MSVISVEDAKRMHPRVVKAMEREGLLRSATKPAPDMLGMLLEYRMNKTEARYSWEVLAPAKIRGEIVSWHFEAVTLRLAKRTRYTPDFFVVRADGGLELHEVKGRRGSGPGGWMDDARVKFKVAAEQFPCFSFVFAHPAKGGGWTVERYKR